MTKKNAVARTRPALLPALLLLAAILWAPKAYAYSWDPPTFSLKEGSYCGTQVVEIACDRDWCVSYTTDGSKPMGTDDVGHIVEPTNPTGSSSVRVPITQSCVIRAVAYRYDGGSYHYSSIATQAYAIYEPDHPLTVSPDSGWFETPLLTVTLSCEEGWEIAYVLSAYAVPLGVDFNDSLVVFENGSYCLNSKMHLKQVSNNALTLTIMTDTAIKAIAYRKTADGCFRFSPVYMGGYHFAVGKGEPIATLPPVPYPSTSPSPTSAPVPGKKPTLELSIKSSSELCYEEGYAQAEDIDVMIINPGRTQATVQGGAVEGAHAELFEFIWSWENPIPVKAMKSVNVGAVRPYEGLAAGQYTISYKIFFNDTSASLPITVTVTAARPTFSLAPGTYIGPQQLTLSTISQGAIIHYTTDGSDPTPESPLYEGPFTVSQSTTVKAIACMDNGDLNSNIVTAAYTIIQPSYTLSLSAPEFDEVTEGYDQPEARPLTIVSSGNCDAEISSVGFLEGGDAFLLNRTDGATVAAGSTDSTTYTVQPAADLAPGSYRAIVTVSYNDGETAAAELNFTVRERRYEVRVYIPEEDSDLGGVTIIGPDTARAGGRVSFMAWMNVDYYDEYQLTEVIVVDTSGNRVEVDYWDGFVMPASPVWLTPVFEPLLPITIELGDTVDLMGIQTDSHGWGWDNAKAAAGETVRMEPMCCDGEYVLASVIVTAEDGSNVPCEHYRESFADEDGVYTDTGWRFVMPNVPVTVSFEVVPIFDEADVVLPAELAFIEAGAFEGDASLSTLDAGSCSYIGRNAFKDCVNLTRIRLPLHCEIDPAAFSGCESVYVFAPAGGVTENSCVRIANCIFIAEDTDSPLQ